MILWLNHERIRSISHLRLLVSSADTEERDGLRHEILNAAAEGRFGQWLKNQPEAGAGSSGESWAKEALSCLLGPDVTLSGDTIKVLGVVCDADWLLPDPGSPSLTDQQTEKQRKASLLREQSWYDREAEDLLAGLADWSLVITCQKDLTRALITCRRSGGGHSLYLCAVCGRNSFYRLNLKGIRNTVVRGFGSPRVMHTELAPGETIDMAEQNLRCEHFDLYFAGRPALTRTEGRSAGFKQKTLGG